MRCKTLACLSLNSHSGIGWMEKSPTSSATTRNVDPPSRRLSSCMSDGRLFAGARPFHAACLYEWLRVRRAVIGLLTSSAISQAIPTSRQAFNTLFGSCTYCGSLFYKPTCLERS
mmetsp:Transcript_16624/g.37970  ORF Transcript_16624/g.37970 Transcript_16624/m.37970 type:complete len:115 (-) Transcript_16624:559-903(-)|eukprot:761192-Hanusia_phi.AAC.2